MRTGFQAWKLSKGLYLIPLLFAYQPEILFTNGFWPAMGVGITGLIALAAGVGALDGYLVVRLIWPFRILLGLIAVAIFWPNHLLSLSGSVAFLVFWALMRQRRKKMLASERSAGNTTLTAHS